MKELDLSTKGPHDTVFYLLIYLSIPLITIVFTALKRERDDMVVHRAISMFERAEIS